ncbi:MAG: SH3 domain-containing protein [Pseudomonadota bacterium]
MFHISHLMIVAVALGLVLTLMLAAWLTPSHWWRQLTLRNLSIVGLGTWAIASLVLALAPAQVAADAGRSYRVHDDLNLRSDKGTASRRIAVVPAGTVVTTTGAPDGDWWQVRAQVGGKEVRGWSSSLWLRRADEL